MTDPDDKDAAPELIGPDRRDTIRRLGYPDIPDLVAALARPAVREHPVVALAGEGSGKELLYGLVAAERCDFESPEVQALVLTATRETALRCGRALHALGAPEGLEALVWLPWQTAEGEKEGGRPFGQLLAGRPVELLPQVRAGHLKLADLRLLVLDGVSSLEDTGQWASVEAFLGALPPGAQKIVVDADRSPRLEELLTHRMARARKWPPELFAVSEPTVAEDEPAVVAAPAPEEEGRIEALAAGIRLVARESGLERAVVRCPDEPTAHRVAASLASRGFELTDQEDEPGLVVAWGEDEPAPTELAALFGLPPGLAGLTGWLGGARGRVVALRPEEVPQLRILTRRAGWPLRMAPEPLAPHARDAVERFRERVRERLESADDHPELLVLEPLVGKFGAARVAAALSGLLRDTAGRAGPPSESEAEARKREEAPPERAREGPRRRERERKPGPDRRREARPARGERSRDEPGVRPAWTRLFISAGRDDGVGPGDLVGAITGETGAVGAQVGQIEVRGSYSLVDVDSQIAEEVMEKLTGVSIKGRKVVAREDREG